MNSARLAQLLCSPLTNALASAVLAALWVLFAWSHYQAFISHPGLSPILVTISETLTAIFYVMRPPPRTISVKPLDWLLAIGGTFMPLGFRPAETALMPAASYLMVLGILIQILALVSLNRSFALVAAKRVIKTDFMYKWVRHPIYASYVITFTGYLLVNTSAINALIHALWLALMIGRIFREEAHLSEDAIYRPYMQRVRYRLIPGVF